MYFRVNKSRKNKRFIKIPSKILLSFIYKSKNDLYNYKNIEKYIQLNKKK